MSKSSSVAIEEIVVSECQANSAVNCHPEHRADFLCENCMKTFCYDCVMKNESEQAKNDPSKRYLCPACKKSIGK